LGKNPFFLGLTTHTPIYLATLVPSFLKQEKSSRRTSLAEKDFRHVKETTYLVIDALLF